MKDYVGYGTTSWFLATLQLLESLITRTVTCYDVIKSGGATKSSTHLKTENYLKKKIENQFLNDE